MKNKCDVYMDGKKISQICVDDLITFDPRVDFDAYMEKVKNINIEQHTGSWELLKTSSIWCNMYNKYYDSFNKTCQNCAANNECIRNKINKGVN